jgi:hypothetical protein
MRAEVVSTGVGLVLFAASVFGSAPKLNARAMTAVQPEERPSMRVARDLGYAPGTLHDVDASRWIASSEENQLATAADWSLAFPKVEASVSAGGDVDELLMFATAMRSCVTRAARAEVNIGLETSTSELAAACGVLLGWVKLGS